MQKTSIIIPSYKEGRNILDTINSIFHNTNEEETPFEIIIVNSSPEDNIFVPKNPLVKYFETPRQGSTISRNFGADNATGEVLVFLDAHMELQKNWLKNTLNSLERNSPCMLTPVIYDINNKQSKGYGFTFSCWDLGIGWLGKMSDETHEIPMACGCCIAVEKEVFNKIGKWDNGVIQWGREDAEISLRSWLMGIPVFLEPSVEVGHLFRSSFPYNVDNYIVNRNILRLAYSHFNEVRIKKVEDTLRIFPDFEKSAKLNRESDVLLRRQMLFEKRVHDDDWFFEKFNIPI